MLFFEMSMAFVKMCIYKGFISILAYFHLFAFYSVLAENSVKEVNKKIFHGLVNLKTLSLYSNKISCVTPGAFDALVSLQSLNLIANPFNCNCHMAWFADWLRTKVELDYENSLTNLEKSASLFSFFFKRALSKCFR